ncbi:putative signal transducing protein [Aeoliella mucimassa]|uniref:DUF2007 domain-containing protein n=1 Tax=Aeoliella mucimassa TaxID=2527972 RepID=A0A518AR13_9BACT|nr:DUF2007 domain-containing protein [Aeoliella mucimassa]QDU57155.1 hypothetical protein Pan181_33690 [Aeoliella mucimassa]
MNDENPYKSPETRADSDYSESESDSQSGEFGEERLVKLTSYSTIAEAQLCQAVLQQEGIDCFLENEASVGVNWLWSNALGGVKLLVPHEQLEAATTLLESVQLTESAKQDLGDITFECEDCGAQITFPGERRGKTETCPKCHEYVDVPE